MDPELLAATPQVKATLLFGSHARGQATPFSDVDLALWLDPGLSPRERFQVRCRLAGTHPEADVVILNDAPDLLLREIERDGQLLFEKEGGQGWRECLTRGVLSCCDSETFRARNWKVFQDSLAHPREEMAPDPSLVAHLNHLRAAQRALADLVRRGRSAVTADEHLSASTLHHLQLAAQSMIDLCARLASRRSLGAAQSYREGFLLLERAGALPGSLSVRLQGWAGLRNVLVHLYLEVEWDLVWATLENELENLEEFLQWARALPELQSSPS